MCSESEKRFVALSRVRWLDLLLFLTSRCVRYCYHCYYQGTLKRRELIT